jgi:cobyrinic acid a,c-diamide synthase
MAHLLISAAHKSSGKTSISVGIVAALRARNLSVQPFKKGPDYIDPMWLARAAGRPCFNLDFNTQSETEIVSLFAERSGDADLSLIEGNKGLYDGLDVEGRDSTAALARLIGAPVILVVDVTGITRGIAPLVLGYRTFDPELAIGGIILNRVASARHETKIRQALERYTDVPVIGAVGRDPGLLVPERHLGLITPEEAESRDEAIDRLRRTIERGVDLDRVVAVAQRARPPSRPLGKSARPPPDIRIAVARDSAFCFYYPDDLAALQQAGAELVFFNALQDASLPNADALLVGGGFPETQMAALAANRTLREQIRRAAEAGMPIYAECGGLMYLTRSIEWRGQQFDMVGFVPADTVMHDKPQGRGLVVLEETDAMPWSQVVPAGPGAAVRIPAHEFHYAALDRIDPSLRYAYRMVRGRGIDGRRDGIVKGNTLASFCHLRSTTQSRRWTDRFIAFIRDCKRGVQKRSA